MFVLLPSVLCHCHVFVQIGCLVVALSLVACYIELLKHHTTHVNYTLKNNCTSLSGLLVIARPDNCIEFPYKNGNHSLLIHGVSCQQ